MKVARGIFLLLGLLLTFVGLASAQVATGTPPLGSFGGGPDVINLANLNVHVPVPVLSKAGRGLPFSPALSYDTSVWYPVGSSGSKTWQPLSSWGWILQTASVTGYLTAASTTVQDICIPIHNPPTYKYVTTTNNFVYHDSSGTTHAFVGTLVNSTGSCSNSNTLSFTATATDVSGLQLNANTSNYDTVVTPSGTVTVAPFLTSSGPASETDANGNEITINSSGVFTDTLGNSALTVAGSGTPASPMTYTYTAGSGSNVAYTVKYTAYTVKTNFGCSGVSEFGPTAENLISEIDLPDGTKYTFAYEATPSFTGDVTGRLGSVTLPKGGTISYAYAGGNSGIECTDGSTAGLTRVTPDGTWTYARTLGTGAATTTTMTAPAYNAQSNQTVINYQGIYETERQTYSGTSSSGTLLDTVYTCYNGANYPCNSTAITLPITQVTKTNSWASGQTSETNATFNANGLPTEVDEYAYAAGSPGGLLRKTTTSYASLGNDILGRPSTVSIYAAGATNPTYQLSYGYDQSSVVATSGTPQHGTVSGSRGNPTTLTYLTQGSSTISTTAIYFDTGTLQTTTDSNGNQTILSYGSASCGNAFATTINLPLSLSRSATWNCNAARVATRTDENSEVTSSSYDSMNRITQTNFPDGGWWLANFTSATQRDIYTGITDTTPSTSCSSCRHDQVILDGLGRTLTSTLVTDPDGATTVAMTYDSLGRSSTKSNPYRSTSDPTYGLTGDVYDPLGRIAKVTVPDGASVNYYYGGDVGTHGGANAQLCSSTTYGVGYPALTIDESGAKHQIWSDARGRTIEADEADASGSLTVGTCDKYDVLNNLIEVDQGGETRTYSYDGLSRKISETTPEAGTTSYYFTTAGNAICSGDLLNVCRRTDARSITTTYAYDALNRMTSTTYSDSTPSVSFYYDESSVVVAGTPYTIKNAKGRLSHSMAAGGTALTLHSYDAVGRAQDLWQCTPYNCSNTSIWNTHYAYDLAGDEIDWQDPSGDVFTQTFSNALRITQIASTRNDATHPGTLAQNVTYSPLGMISRLQNGCAGTNCTQELETYDYNNRLQEVRYQLGTSTNSSASECLVYNYYSGIANPSSCSIPLQGSTGNNRIVMGHYLQDSANPTQAHQLTDTYDTLNRLVTSVATGSATHNLAFSYDRFGNMSCLTNSQTNGPCPNYSFTSSTNAISNSGFSYDSAGNLTADGSGTGTHTYQWDAENRLKSIDNGTTATYTYNALGQRVEKLVGSTYTEYAYHADSGSLGENNRTGWSLIAIPFGDRHLAHYDGSSNATYFLHADGLGSVSQASDPTGAIVQDQLYYPWGQSWSLVGSTKEDRFARLGHRDDTETGLDPTYFRMFSSIQGRWLTTDPAPGLPTNPQTFNRYSYARNIPTSLTDPQGDQECDPDDPFCGFPFPFPLFLDSINISFTCPDNRCSCCAYYDWLIANGPTWEDRTYGKIAHAVCEVAGSSGPDCILNSTRWCLVDYNEHHCDSIPSPIKRNSCREFAGHAYCIPFGLVVGNILNVGIHVDFFAPFPFYFSENIVVPFTCTVPGQAGQTGNPLRIP